MERRVKSKASKKQSFILYALGEYYSEANRKLKSKPIAVAISKSVFIDLLMKTKITNKKQRALYRNLEQLEKKHLTSYKDKVLRLTKKGQTEYRSIKKDIETYINLAKILSATELYRLAKRSQTLLK